MAARTVPVPRLPTDIAGDIHLGNDKGLFVTLKAVSVVSSARLDAIEAWLLGLSDLQAAPSDRASARRVVAALRALPTIDDAAFEDYGAPSVVRQRPHPVHRLTLVDHNANASGPTTKIPAGGMAALGWSTLAPVLSDWSALTRLMRAHPKVFGEYGWYGLDSVRNKMRTTLNAFQKTTLRFRGATAAADHTDTDGVLVFLPDEATGGGFYSIQGGAGPLPQARLYPSETAAHRAMGVGRRGHTPPRFIAVRARLSVVDVPDKSDLTGKDTANLAAAIALTDRRALDAALQEATVEQLKVRLAELEGGVPSSSTPRRRTM